MAETEPLKSYIRMLHRFIAVILLLMPYQEKEIVGSCRRVNRIEERSSYPLWNNVLTSSLY